MAAELQVTLASVSGRATAGDQMPAFDGTPSASQTMTAPSTASTIVAGNLQFARLVNSGDAALYVSIAETPNPSQEPRWLLPVGQTLTVHAPEGCKFAFVAKT